MLAAIDLETTGREPGVHEIIQIAIVPFDGSPIFHRYIKPVGAIEPTALAKHGLTADLLQHEADASEVFDWLNEWIAGRRIQLVAHNLSFEWSFLTATLGADYMGENFWKSRCTFQMALLVNDLFGQPFKSFSLTALCQHFGIRFSNAHNALYDAYACKELYNVLTKFKR